MKNRVSVADARLHFSDLLGKVAYRHEEFVITKKGKPVARLVPFEAGIEEESSPKSLAEVKGWLEYDDPFFGDLDHIRAVSRTESPRNPFS